MSMAYADKRQDPMSFILYNLIFSKSGHTFTLPGLMEEIKVKYGVDVDREFVQWKVNEYIQKGLVYRKTSCYASLQ